MTEKRYKAIPETASYKDTVTGEILCPKCEKDYYKVLDLLNENEQLKEKNQELYDKLQVTMSKHSLQMGETELIKHMIQEAYTYERLKQLMEAIE